MDRLIEQVLERAGLTEEEFASCGSVNLPDAVRAHLDLTPGEVVGALRAGELDKLAGSTTVWLSGWEPVENLGRLLAGVRGVLKDRSSSGAASFYRSVLEELERSGRFQHARWLEKTVEAAGEAPTVLAQRVALRVRGKLKGSAGAADGLAELRRDLAGGADGRS